MKYAGPIFDPETHNYRVYADSREFGLDYTRSTAYRLAFHYALMFPGIRYTVRDRLGRFA